MYKVLYLFLLTTAYLVLVNSKKDEEDVQISPELRLFTGTLEKYATTPNEVVFLLDESGSIGADKYPQVKLFTELTVRHLAVSADQSRIAVIAFSDYPRTHVNYIKDSYGNNMCTLIRKIHAIDYIGQGTATRLAMEAAREVFAQARPHSNKIIVLITDGQSNYGFSPVDEAYRMKSDGVIIFAVGVAYVNTEEIDDVATSKDHIYILKEFSYIEKVNSYLKKEIKEFSWDYVDDTSLCNDFCSNHSECCDDNAKCYCGTTGGTYECNCGVGYFGTGHKHGCHACPKGTYKSTVGNKDCTPCPDHSSTLHKGSTSASDCICDNGYVWNGNYCKIMECAKLNAPSGGILIPPKCSNVFGTKCHVKCQEGFCPYSCNFPDDDFHTLPWNKLPLQSRTCLETGQWSGNDFVCEKMRCTPLEHPFYGKHNCSDFSFGSKCAFECDEGYELSGSNIRECQLNGSWTGKKATCSVKYCEPLKPNENLLVKNKKCSESRMPYRSVCIYYCRKGYSLTSQYGKNDGINECLDNKTWSGASNQITCQDISPPSIQCPKSIVKNTEPSKSTALVTWDMPNATDNIFVNSIHVKQPKFIRKPPYSFSIGSEKIVYEAIDSVDLSSTCSFNVTILDKEPPVVLHCPSDIEVYSENSDPIRIEWDEPEFEDNSGKYILSPPNKKSGDFFAWGSHDVIYYNVTDASKNKASCNFTVIVKPYPCSYFKPPENGIVTCDKWQFGRLCSVFCNEGYEFASIKKVPTVFECKQRGSSLKKTGTWVPFELLDFGEFQMPVPDCSRKQKRSAVDVSLNLNYTVNECNDEVISKMKLNFLNTLRPFDEMLPGMICRSPSGDLSCSPENVNVACVNNKLRGKRIIRRSTEDKITLVVSFSFRLNQTEESNAVVEQTTNLVAQELESTTSETLRNVYNVTDVPEPEVNYDFLTICSVGQLRINNSCINCPTGTYKDDFRDACVDCSSSTYQDEEKSLSCKACPVGYTTYQMRSKSLSDCKAPCQPGSYSRTSFEPCFPCPLHTFQNLPRSQECTRCPRGLKTWKTGSSSSSDCTTACKPGSYSDTGMEPCILCDIGFYQDKEEQKSCEICPNNTSTREKGSQTFDKCNQINSCEELNPCTNGSTCVPHVNGYNCICAIGFFGIHCEESINYCEDDFCLNNGTCVKKLNNYECVCPEGFTGRRCEVNINDCKPGLCRNGGQCIDLINDYECQCQVGYSGSNCEINIYECASNPCLNGGSCFDKLNDYKCCCAEGYTGLNCDTKIQPIDLCENVHCQNGGVCISSNSSVECSCTSGFVGEFCEINVDDCINHTCYNEGICVDGIQNATCQCKKRFSGPQCEKDLLPYSLSFTNPTTEDYAKIENKNRLTAITVSLFMRTSYKADQSRPTPFSYCYYDEVKKVIVDNALVLFDTNKMIIYLHDEILHTRYSANQDSNWHHYAITWEKNGGKWAFFVDGDIIVEGTQIGEEKYIWPGVFVLGQEQDTLGATFSSLEAFVGDITEFNVWDYALSQNEIKFISKSCGFSGNVISWFQVSNHLYGSLIVSEDVDLCKVSGICSEESCQCLYSTSKSDDYCKHAVEQCNSNSCQNEQPCVQEDPYSYCNCSIGYNGRTCEYDVNECLDDNGGCSHSCINTVGSYYCDCPEHMILSDNGLKCKDTTFCEVDGQVFLDGQTWMSSCRECLCNKSSVICQDLQCIDINCSPEENFILLPGDCCPQCVLYSFCLISPNNSLTSFDYSRYEFTEDCSYTVVEDCVHGQFSVRMEFSGDIDNSTKTLSVYQSCSHLQLTKVDNVLINNDAILPPFVNDEFNVKSTNVSTDIWTNSGLYIQWYSNGEILVAVPSQMADYSCGICGAFQKHNIMTDAKHKEIGFTSEKTCFGKIEDNPNATNKAPSIVIGYSLAILMLILYLVHYLS